MRGIKKHVSFPSGPPALHPHVEVTAVVTVTDDGGSSGRLRREMEVPPPGDIRNCMVALSEDEALLSRLFQYRFASGRGLKGHSFGNLFLTALTHLTGDFAKAIAMSSEVLASRGRIFPSTAANVTVEAELEDGSTVAGESKISRGSIGVRRIRLLPPKCKPLRETLHALERADLICLGPGSLYTSVIPNLLVQGIPLAIARSGAVKAYFVNLMWQPGETMNYTASDHVKALYRHAGGSRWSGRRLVDTVVVNTRPVPAALRRRYAATRVFPVKVDAQELEEMGLRVVGRNLLDNGGHVRHSPQAAAEVAVELAMGARSGA